MILTGNKKIKKGPMTKIVFKGTVATAYGVYEKGNIADFPDKHAEKLIEKGKAEKFEEKKKEEKAKPKTKERKRKPRTKKAD